MLPVTSGTLSSYMAEGTDPAACPQTSGFSTQNLVTPHCQGGPDPLTRPHYSPILSMGHPWGPAWL